MLRMFCRTKTSRRWACQTGRILEETVDLDTQEQTRATRCCSLSLISARRLWTWPQKACPFTQAIATASVGVFGALDQNISTFEMFPDFWGERKRQRVRPWSTRVVVMSDLSLPIQEVTGRQVEELERI